MLLSIHYEEQYNFVDLSCENLRKVLATCALNKGSWLKKEQMQRLGRHKFKHASKFETAFVARIIGYLSKTGLLRLEEAETLEVLHRLRAAKTDEIPHAGRQAQNDEQSQPAELVGSVTSVEHSESSQLSVTGEASEAEELVVVEEPTETAALSEVNEEPETDELNETEESEVLVLD